MDKASRVFAITVLGWALGCAVLFLFLSSFFASWRGRAVSVRRLDPERAMVQVLVVEDDGARFETFWPREAVEGLDLPVDPLALPPSPLPEGLPRTRKKRFSLTFSVEPAGAAPRLVPTTSPGSLGLALLVFFLGIGVRNMVVAGTPFAIARPEAPPRTHTAAPPVPPRRGRARGRKGPPPGRRRRGRGRRR